MNKPNITEEQMRIAADAIAQSAEAMQPDTKPKLTGVKQKAVKKFATGGDPTTHEMRKKMHEVCNKPITCKSFDPVAMLDLQRRQLQKQRLLQATIPVMSQLTINIVT